MCEVLACVWVGVVGVIRAKTVSYLLDYSTILSAACLVSSELC